MKKSGASLIVYALEQIGVKFTFGIPGAQITEIYDALNSSSQIQPVLTTHEMSAAFMADAISRTTESIGTVVIVPAAGTTHAMSGIGEAYLDGIPMLVISGGIRQDTGKHYQLHQIDQSQLLSGIVKKSFLIKNHASIIPTVYEAYNLAISGTPGPVFIELPADIQFFEGEVEDLPKYIPNPKTFIPDPTKIEHAVKLLKEAKNPGIYAGWGAKECTDLLIQIAELLEAPVSTTLQGLSVFPADHPLHTGMGFGAFAVPAAEKAFANCDCLLTIGARFSELATGSYSLPVPKRLIHIDINPEVFNKNYPAEIAITGDASTVLGLILKALKESKDLPQRDRTALRGLIKEEKEKFQQEWTKDINPERVSPGHFFKTLRKKLEKDAFVVVDDGNHTFLTEEQFPIYKSKHFISPTDFNAMGYCVPAAIATKLSHPDKQVVGIVGDGAFLMTGLEMVTASSLNLGILYFYFNDGELAQISQFQEKTLRRKTCTVLGNFHAKGVAEATGVVYLQMKNDTEIEKVLDEALKIIASGKSVIIDVNIDYSKKTRFTKGIVKSNIRRLGLKEKIRVLGRTTKRAIFG